MVEKLNTIINHRVEQKSKHCPEIVDPVCEVSVVVNIVHVKAYDYAVDEVVEPTE